MKAIILTFSLAFLLANTVYSQNVDSNWDENQTLFMPSSKVTGWFVEFNNTFSQMNGKDTWMPGLAGGVVMNKSVYLGLRVKSLSWYETYLVYDNVLPEEFYLNGGYCGLYMEPTINRSRLLHISIPFTMGGGGATYLSKIEYPEIEEDGEIDYSRKELSASPFFVIEPGVNVELNITGFMRITSGYSYRWLLGLNLENTSSKALNGGSFNLGLKFGKF